MWFRLIAAVLTLCLSLFSAFAQTRTITSDAAIKKVDAALETALQKGDSEALNKIVADDYIEIDTQGTLRNKGNLLEVARAMAKPRGISLGPERVVDERIIRVYSDTAIVSGRTTIRHQFMENQTTSSQAPSQNPMAIDQERFIKVYARTGAQWKLISRQTTFIARR